jgi:hypothetical protein
MTTAWLMARLGVSAVYHCDILCHNRLLGSLS